MYMRAYFESGFYVLYLVFIIGLGIYLLIKSKDKKEYLLFGLACFILGAGDSFHLVPRAIGLFNKTLDSPDQYLAMWLGIGKLVTSITMTIFYLLFYFFIYKRSVTKRNIYVDITVYVLVATRFILCAFPQNGWISNNSPLIWGICRNIPFVLLGILVIILCFKHLREFKYFKLLWIAIILSFGFYLPVVLFASMASWVGMLMLPKTICYMWIGVMGFLDYKKS